jgi:hypothetical protein
MFSWRQNILSTCREFIAASSPRIRTLDLGMVRQCPTSVLTTQAGNTKGGSITVLLTSCLTSLELAV